MPQPDPWAPFRQQPAPQVPVQPQPFPGAAPVQVQVNPAKTQAVQNAAQQAVIQANQDRRGDAGVAMEAERLRMAKEEHDRKEASLAANGGIETHADENTAAALGFRMKRDLDMIKLIQAKHPEALQPGARETLGTLSSNQWVKDAAIPDHIRGPRLQLNNLYKDFVQNSIYAASGAAFNQSEMDTKLASLMPSYWDTPEVLQTKQYGLETEIGAAMLKAGAAQSKIDTAIQQFRDSAGQLYSKNSGISTPLDQGSPQSFQASDNKQAVQINPDMQKEFEGWLSQHPRGTLTTKAFLDMYQALAKKYEYDLPLSSIAQAEEYVKGYNKGNASVEIPRPNRELSSTEQEIASGTNSAPGIFFKNVGNAGSLGLAELFAGAEGRRASQLGDAAHPTAAVAGDVVGSLAPVVGLEGAIGRGASHVIENAVARKIATEAAANGAYGAIRGANAAEPGHRGEEALLGAAAGAGGALAARGLVKGAKGFMGKEAADAISHELSAQKFATPSERDLAEMALPKNLQGQSPAALEQQLRTIEARIQTAGNNPAPADVELQKTLSDYLAKSPEGGEGVIPKSDLTTFQRAGLGRAEEFLQGLPGIHGQREAAMASWNTKRGAEILAGSGMHLPKGTPPGRETIAAVNDALGKGYDQALIHVKGTVDNDFNNAVAAIRQKALSAGGKDRQEAWQEVEQALAQFRLKGGNFTGDSYKEFTARLDTLAERFGADGQDVAKSDIAAAADLVKLQARALVGRNNPAVYNRLKKLDTSWAKFKDMQRASVAGPVLSERGIVTPDDMLASMKARDTSPDKTDFAAGRYPGQKQMEDARHMLGGRPAKKSSLQQTGVGFYVGGTMMMVPAAAAYVPALKRVSQAIIDGKIGATPKAMKDFLNKTALGKAALGNIDGNARQRLLQQLIRVKAQKKMDK